ncbi:unnamed protein product [Rhizoctonia solani]|uniref:Laminin domain protein n=1 Tax=Rhizoctonia solani TaxID=456999 RepID=A0A8H3HWS2_9AGAM|nr:unnamed protein product [Rhizoctonia solani]
MSSYAAGQIYSPPELPPYLKAYDLRPIVGVPTDQELISIHAVMRIVQTAVDIPGMGAATLLAQLSDYLFSVQLAKYRNKYMDVVFPENTTYTPPALPAHLSVQLEPISGVPSDEEITGCNSILPTVRKWYATARYQKFRMLKYPLLVSSIFDPSVNMELSQYLFDIQMARYQQRAKQSRLVSVLPDGSIAIPAKIAQQTDDSIEQDREVQTEDGVGFSQSIQMVPNPEIRDAIERSNQLADRANQLVEQTNLLIERSNQIAERANQLSERSSQPVEQSSSLLERFTELFGRLNGHFEHSNRLAEISTKPVEKLEEALRDISRVLARIQHAIVRNHTGNTVKAADCLTNEKGYTPGGVEAGYGYFDYTSKKFTGQAGCQLPVMVNGTCHDLPLNDVWLGIFLRFYGVGENYFESKTSNKLRDAAGARIVFGRYLSSCLG